MVLKNANNSQTVNSNIKKEQFWRDVFKKQAESSETVRSFCRSHNLACSSFYKWRSKIINLDNKRVSPANTQSRFTQVTLPPNSTPLNSFSNNDIEIKTPSGHTLRAGGSVPLERISAILKVL